MGLTVAVPAALLVRAAGSVPQRTTLGALRGSLGVRRPRPVRASPVAHITLSAPGPATDRWICACQGRRSFRLAGDTQVMLHLAGHQCPCGASAGTM